MAKKRKSKKKEYWGLPKDVRKELAKTWVEAYEGENIIKAYSKVFKLSLEKAMKELNQIGVQISQEAKDKAKAMIRERKLEKERKKEKRNRNTYETEESDEVFAFIAGYTEGGFPYGLTHEEMEEIENKERSF